MLSSNPIIDNKKRLFSLVAVKPRSLSLPSKVDKIFNKFVENRTLIKQGPIHIILRSQIIDVYGAYLTTSFSTDLDISPMLPKPAKHTSRSPHSSSTIKRMPHLPMFRGKSKKVGGGVTGRTSRGDAEGLCRPYIVPKVKELPKLHRAVWKENLTKLKAASKDARRASINSLDKQGRTALHLACAKGLRDFILHLVSVSKADTNIQDADRCTPMHRLLDGGYRSPLKYLLDHGANPNLANRNGHTPLHVAAHVGDVRVAQLLLDRDACIDDIDKHGHTPLHLAALKGHHHMLRALLHDGADPNAQDGNGMTCLMLACAQGSVKIVKTLCDHRVNFDLEDHFYGKAIDYAAAANHPKCADLVEKYHQRLEREAELQAISLHPPHSFESSSSLDSAFMYTTYVGTGIQDALPSPEGAAKASGPALDGCPALACAHTPTHSIDSSSIGGGQGTSNDCSWAPSDIEEMTPPIKPSLITGMSLFKRGAMSAPLAMASPNIVPTSLPAILTDAPSANDFWSYSANVESIAEPAVNADTLSSHMVDEHLPEYDSANKHYGFGEDVKPKQLDHNHKRDNNGPLKVMLVSQGEAEVAYEVGAGIVAKVAMKVSGEMVAELDAGKADKVEKKEEKRYSTWSVFDDDRNTSTFDDISDCVSELLHDCNHTVARKTLQTSQFITTKTQAAARKQMMDEALSTSESGGEERTGKMMVGAGETTPIHKETDLYIQANSDATLTKDSSVEDERVNGNPWVPVPMQDNISGEEMELATDSQSTQRDLIQRANKKTSFGLLDFDSTESETTESGSDMRSDRLETDDCLLTTSIQEKALTNSTDFQDSEKSVNHRRNCNSTETQDSWEDHFIDRLLQITHFHPPPLHGTGSGATGSGASSVQLRDPTLGVATKNMPNLDISTPSTLSDKVTSSGHHHGHYSSHSRVQSHAYNHRVSLSRSHSCGHSRANSPGDSLSRANSPGDYPGHSHANRPVDYYIRHIHSPGGHLSRSLASGPAARPIRSCAHTHGRSHANSPGGHLGHICSCSPGNLLHHIHSHSPGDRPVRNYGHSPGDHLHHINSHSPGDRPVRSYGHSPGDHLHHIPGDLPVRSCGHSHGDHLRHIRSHSPGDLPVRSYGHSQGQGSVHEHTTHGRDQQEKSCAWPTTFTTTITTTSAVDLTSVPRVAGTVSASSGQRPGSQARVSFVSPNASPKQSSDQLNRHVYGGAGHAHHDNCKDTPSASFLLPRVAGMSISPTPSHTSSLSRGAGISKSMSNCESLLYASENSHPTTPNMPASMSCDQALTLQDLGGDVLCVTDVENGSQLSGDMSAFHQRLAHKRLDFGGYQGGELCIARDKLEQQLLQAELDNRELTFTIRKCEESLKVGKVLYNQLEEQVKRLEKRLQCEVEGREVAELKVKQYEVTERTHELDQQQLIQERRKLRDQLQDEIEARTVQEGLYHEQFLVLQSVQCESDKCQCYQVELVQRLTMAEHAKANIDQQLQATIDELSRLRYNIVALQQKEQSLGGAHSSELKLVKEQLQDMEQRNIEAETRLLEVSQTYDQNLLELKEKAHLLTMTLDEEAAAKKCVDKEVLRLRAEMDELIVKCQEKIVLAYDRKQLLDQKLEEKTHECLLTTCELKNSRETVSQQKKQLEVMDTKLGQSQSSLKDLELSLVEKNHQIKALELTCQQKEDRVCVLEETEKCLEQRTSDLEARLAGGAQQTSTLQSEKEELLQQVEFSQLKINEAENSVAEMLVKVTTMTEIVQADQDKIHDLQDKLNSEQGQREAVESSSSALESAHRSVQQNLTKVESELDALRNQLSAKEEELFAGQTNESELVRKLEQMTQLHGSLEAVISEQKKELARLQHEVTETSSIVEKATSEAEHAKYCLKAEVNAKTHLGSKLTEMETVLIQNRTEMDSLLANCSQERCNMNKVLATRKSLEERLESVQHRCVSLEEEVGRLKEKHLADKQLVKKLQDRENVLPSLKSKLVDEKAKFQREQEELRGLLKSTRELLRKEKETRLEAELEVTKAKQVLDLNNSVLSQRHDETACKDRELTRANLEKQHLADEVSMLKERLNDNILCRDELEMHKKAVDGKAREELLLKLEQVNCHMDQQSQAQELAIRMHEDMEVEWKSKFKESQVLVKRLQHQLKTNKESSYMDINRWKDIYEKEVRHSEKLASQVQRLQEKAAESNSNFYVEQNRTEKQRNTTETSTTHQDGCSSLLHHQNHHPIITTSAPTSRTAGTSHTCLHDGRHSQDLLDSVRAQLDGSISQHLESQHLDTSVNTCNSGEDLDSIQRNYHI